MCVCIYICFKTTEIFKCSVYLFNAQSAAFQFTTLLTAVSFPSVYLFWSEKPTIQCCGGSGTNITMNDAG